MPAAAAKGPRSLAATRSRVEGAFSVSHLGVAVTAGFQVAGHIGLDGFVPGTKAWVLSTGLAGDAQGSPSAFASTAPGLPGDPQLSSHPGHRTVTETRPACTRRPRVREA